MKKCLFSHRLVGLGVVFAGLALLAPAAAMAQSATNNNDPCDSANLTQPFSQWNDSSYYKLAPGGDFEGSLSGWTITGGAHTVAGSEPFGVTGSVGSKSMDLTAGSSVQTPFTCVDLNYPSFRFFERDDGLLSTLLVQVVYQAPVVGQVVLPVGAVALSGKWAPTLPMLTLSAVPATLQGGVTRVALRFTELTGSSQIDDIYVDPRMH
jgi:hypothetical protein